MALCTVKDGSQRIDADTESKNTCFVQLPLFHTPPLLLAVVGFAVGIYLISVGTVTFLATLLCCSLISASIVLALKKYKACIFILAVILGISRAAFAMPEPHADGYYSVVGTIYDKSPGSFILLSDVILNGERVSGKMFISAAADSPFNDGLANVGDTLTFTASLAFTSNAESNNTGYKYSQLSKNITSRVINASNVNAIPHSGITLHKILIRVRNGIGERIDAQFGVHAPMMRGMILNDVEHIEPYLLESVRTAGIAHILSLSGLHVSILCTVLMKLMSKTKTAVRITAVIVFLSLYCALTAFPSPLVRSSLMVGYAFTSVKIRRRRDMLMSLLATALLILVVSPLAFYSVSFLMSFSAIFGLAVLTKPLKRAQRGLLHYKLAEAISASLAATVAIFPISIFCFGATSTYGIIANMAAVPISSVALITGITALSVGCIWAPLAIPLNIVTQVSVWLLDVISMGIEGMPFAEIAIPNFPMLAVLLLLFAVFLVSDYVLRPFKTKGAYASVAMLLCAAVVFCS